MRIRILSWTVAFLLALFLQTSVISNFSIAGNITPDLVLIVLFLFAMRFGRLGGIWGGFFIGLLLDIYTVGALGTYALTYTMTGAFVGFFEQRKLATELLLQLIFLVMACLLSMTILHAIVYGLKEVAEPTFYRAVVTGFLPRTLYTAIVGGVILTLRAMFWTPSRLRK